MRSKLHPRLNPSFTACGTILGLEKASQTIWLLLRTCPSRHSFGKSTSWELVSPRLILSASNLLRHAFSSRTSCLEISCTTSSRGWLSASPSLSAAVSSFRSSPLAAARSSSSLSFCSFSSFRALACCALLSASATRLFCAGVPRYFIA